MKRLPTNSILSNVISLGVINLDYQLLYASCRVNAHTSFTAICGTETVITGPPFTRTKSPTCSVQILTYP